MRAILTTTTAALAMTILGGCGKKASPPPPPLPPTAAAPAPASAPMAVTMVELGKRVGPDQRVTAPATTFGVRDTIYASVSTTGSSPSATLTARWTYETNQVIDSTSVSIAPTGPAVTEFHVMKPSGWPLGRYKVTILLNGAAVTEKDFEVK